MSNCYDKVILTCVQCIIQNMIATEHENVSQQLHSIQAYGFGGLWRFAGPFTKVSGATRPSQDSWGCTAWWRFRAGLVT